ncbi:MAG TPA: glycerophosphodiester phosphodiesterase [Steroidobacteraceae bacterium]|jgi:glycerophosphoryl diester phosphodiesterase|nr:glycerophosphodiester phosphodiesterase [Steroidobacteraceae bacterium]
MSAPLVIGHRGASGHLPEHTLASYLLAIKQGADYIEPDLVMTADGVLVARHENEIGGTTDVARHPEFAGRRRRQTIDGVEVEGWFTEDFAWAELRTLRARERLPALRPHNASFDGQFEIPALAEILQMLEAVNAKRLADGQAAVGIYAETKHPSHFAAAGLALERPLLAQLEAQTAGTPVFLQSFETANLRMLHGLTAYPLVQLVDAQGGPWDLRLAARPRSYRELLTPAGLADIATYAAVIGAHKELVLPRTAKGQLGTPSTLVRDAHAAGLAVHAWTFRAENEFLPAALRSDADPTHPGDIGGEIRRHLEAGLDGFFTDQPEAGRKAVDLFSSRERAPP